MSGVPITFRKAVLGDRELVYSWYQKPHVTEYWDNSQETWDNFVNYVGGSKEIFDYWIGLYAEEPYSLIMTSDIDSDAPEPYKSWQESNGITRTLDFLIGEEKYLGKGLGAITLKVFMGIQPESVTAFLIDPAQRNEKATYVYKKAGFEIVGTFIPKEGYFKGLPHFLMKLKRI